VKLHHGTAFIDEILWIKKLRWQTVRMLCNQKGSIRLIFRFKSRSGSKWCHR